MTVRLGYLLPTRERIMVGVHETSRILELADVAEAVGLDSVWIGDSLLFKPRHEPLALLAAIAGRTKRITLGTAVLLPMLRNPVLLAHQAANQPRAPDPWCRHLARRAGGARRVRCDRRPHQRIIGTAVLLPCFAIAHQTIDQISEGRLILGVGTSRDVPAARAEFEAAGVPFEKRIGRMLEGIRLCRALWTGEKVSWEGRWTVTDATLAPKPFTPGGPTIWGDGAVPGALKRSAVNFEGWMPAGPGDGAAWGSKWTELKGYAAEAGRDPAAITGAAYVTVAVNQDSVAAQAELDDYLSRYYNLAPESVRADQHTFAGERAAVTAWLNGFVEAGATHLCVRFAGSDDERQMEVLAGMGRQFA